LRGADNALSQLLIATLHQHPGYTVAEVIGHLQHSEEILRAAAEEVPALLQQADPDSPTLAVGLDFWRALLDSDRHVVPSNVLEGAGRWVFVDSLDDYQWLALSHRILELTQGRIDYPIEVAKRASAHIPNPMNLQMLTLLIDKGEPWKQSYVRDLAVDLLSRAAEQRGTPEFLQLRTRLLELGRHDIVDNDPPS
jgi:hypothetical protein